MALVHISRTLSGRVSPSPGYAAEMRRTPALAKPATNPGAMSYVPESPRTRTVCGTNGVGGGSVVTTSAAGGALDGGTGAGAVVADDAGADDAGTDVEVDVDAARSFRT